MLVKGVRCLLELVLLVSGLYMAAPGVVDLVNMVNTHAPEQPAESIQSLALVWIIVVLLVVLLAEGISVSGADMKKGFQHSRFTENTCLGLILTGVSALTMLHSESSFWLVMAWLLSWIVVSFIRTKILTERDSDAAGAQTEADTKPSDTPAGS